MKIFGYEIRRAENQPTAFKKTGGFYMTNGEMPNTNIDLFYKHYRINSDCRRCVQEIQEAVWFLWFNFSIDWEQVSQPQYESILSYGRWFRVLKNKIIRDVAIAWNAYIVKLKNANNVVIWLDTIDPRTVRPVADEYGEVVEYQQHVNGKKVKTYPVEDVVSCYDELDPDNEVFGLSTMEGIIIDILSDNESALMNYSYFKNNAIPSLILKAWSNVSNDELQNTMQQMRKNFSGGKNKHKIGILKGIDWVEKLQDGMTDMNFEIMRWFNTNRTCAAFGVPKVILGYTDWVNYTNANIQYKKFIDNTITPREHKIEAWISEALWLDDSIEFNLVSAQYEVDREKVEIIEMKIRNWLLTPNEAREELGYNRVDQEEADELLVSKAYDKLVDVWLSNIPFNDT